MTTMNPSDVGATVTTIEKQQEADDELSSDDVLHAPPLDDNDDPSAGDCGGALARVFGCNGDGHVQLSRDLSRRDRIIIDGVK